MNQTIEIFSDLNQSIPIMSTNKKTTTTYQPTVRLSEDAIKVLDELKSYLKTSRTGAVEYLIENYAKREITDFRAKRGVTEDVSISTSKPLQTVETSSDDFDGGGLSF